MITDELKRLNEIKNILIEADLGNGISPDKLCLLFERLGPTFIKIGQILSTRVDLVPMEYADSLSKLRSNVLKMSDSEVIDILKNEYPDYSSIFKSIGKCVGSASIAQVHRAVLTNGDEVVIKVCRPNVYEQMEMDIRLLKHAIKITHLDKIIKVIDIIKALDEVLAVSYEESNFDIEKKNIIKFRECNVDCDYVYAPYVYQEYSTNKVLVMEYVSGISMSNMDTLESRGYDLEEISYLLSDNYIKQALEDGFFHADPHPDNIVISNGKITYLDFGMMGCLKDKNKTLLKECIKNIIHEDYYEVANNLVMMSEKTYEVDMLSLKMDISTILKEYSNSDLEAIDVKKFIMDMFNMLKKNHLILDEDVTMLIRGICVIEATLENLNPNLSLINALMNHVEVSNDKLIDGKKIVNATRKVVNSTKNLFSLSDEALSFLKALNNGDSKIRLEHSASTKQVDKLEIMLHELIIGIIDASLILAYSLQGNSSAKIVMLIGIIVLSLWLVIRMLIDCFHRGY